MMVLVDTSVWSLVLRRKEKDLSARQREMQTTLEKLIVAGQVQVPGIIRQEVLTGIRDKAQYEKLRSSLRAFKDVELFLEDYEEAASMSNRCRTRGVSGSAVDFLICAVATRRKWSILTTDQDFLHYSKHIPVTLFPIA